MIINNIRKTISFLKRNGIKSTFYAVSEKLGKNEAYIPSVISPEQEEEQKKWSAVNSDLKISLAVPAYNTPEKYLRELIDSCIAQTYPNWELVLADAGDRPVKGICDSYEEPRIKYLRLETNGGISENTNAAIDAATGDYIGLVDHDDFITPDCLYECVRAIKDNPEISFLYTDEDKCDGDAQKFFDPHRKLDFNFDLLLSNNYICHFALYRADIIRELKLRKEFDGSQDFDLSLRTADRLRRTADSDKAIVHVVKVLYHWRCHEASTASNPASKTYAYEAGKRALQAFCESNNWAVEVTDSEHWGFFRVNWNRDIFVMRPELGAVGGRVVKGRRITGGAMNAEGEVIYENLNVNYAGAFMRATLTQDVEALDIRNLRLNPSLTGLYREIIGTEYSENGNPLIDSMAESVIREKSLALSGKIREKGYTLLYIPDRKF